MENRMGNENYYDNYVDRQLKMGLNHRHFSIIKLLLENGMKQSDKVLEIGAGIGTVTGLIARKVKKKIVANDISPKSLEAAKARLLKFKQIEYLAGDILNLEIKETFDVIVLPDVLEHIPLESHAVLFDKLSDLLDSQGWIFIHIPNPYYLEWVINNQPELTQELDQPVHLEVLTRNLHTSGLFIDKMVNYSIYINEDDYRYLVLRKKMRYANFSSTKIKPHSILRKIKIKLGM